MELQSSEKVIQTVYRSISAYLLAIIIAVVLIIGPCFFIVPLWRLGWWGQVIFGVVVLVGLVIALRTLVVAINSNLIVTSQRLVFNQRRGLFNQAVVKINIEQIKNINLTIRGFWATIFRTGAIQITLQNQPEIVCFAPVSRPQQLQELLLSQQNKKRKTDLTDLTDYELIDLTRQIRHRLGRDVLRRITDEPS